MRDPFQMKAVAIRAVNSGEFVAKILEIYAAGGVVLLESAARQLPRNPWIEVTDEITPGLTSGWHQFTYCPSASDAPAQISFTSGTTGVPKGIVISHRALGDVVLRLNAVMGLTSDVREYVGVPVNYSFGFGRCRAVGAVGGSCYLPESGFNPLEIAEMAQRGEINAISAVPTQWRTILQNPGLLGEAGARIRWIEIGSQSMSADEKLGLRRLFPNAKIVQHYGLTEASRTTFLEISEATPDQLDSVGKAVGETEVAISDAGRIRIRGPHVALGQLTEHGIEPIVDADGWLETNDLGHIRGGMLYFEGRADDLINCGGVKVPAELFEKTLLERLERASGIAVGPASDPLRGEVVLVVSEAVAGPPLAMLQDAAAIVAEQFGIKGKGTVVFATCEELPRTSTGKIKRKELASLMAVSSADAPTDADAGDLEAQIVAVWEQVLGMRAIPRDASFFELGGDSLSALSAMIRMETLKVDRSIARKLFEGRTIREITREMQGAAAAPIAPIAAGNNVINCARGLLVCLVIGVHWLPGVWKRLPAIFANMDTYLVPIYRFGTPGFAMVFGLGLGYFQIPMFQSNVSRFLGVVRRNAAILLLGVIVLAVFKAGADFYGHRDASGPTIVSSFFSVLLYYLLAILFSPVLIRIVARSSNVASNCLLLAIASFGAGAIASKVVSASQSSGVLEVARLMMIAKYNIFAMTGVVFLGAAVGCSYRERIRVGDAGRQILRMGLVVLGFAFLTCHYTDGLAAWRTTGGFDPWAIGAYLGVLLVLLGLFHAAFTSTRVWMPLMRGLQALVVIGMLALPAFVFHEIVIPAKAILVGVGVPGKLAIAIPLGGFLLGMGYAFLRISRMYFGGRAAPPSAMP